MISAGNFRGSLMSVTIFIGGSLLISAQPAQANHGSNRAEFRSFRHQNPDMGRHELRKLFNSERRGQSTSGASVPVPSTVGVLPGVSTLPPTLANHVRNNSQQLSNNGSLIRLNSGVDLDLGSGSRNITLGANLFSSNAEAVTITVGGQSKTVNAGSRVSAAEYVAVKQVLSGGAQQVTIDASGAAVGGQVDLGSLTTDGDRMRATNLVVAGNVTAYGDFGKHSDFRLAGDLTNFGTVHALSTDNELRHGVIGARDINNRSGALICSDVDLTLDASRNINNDGTINSSGSLTLSAGGAVNNHGTISSAANVNLSAPGDLTVNNTGGIISAAGAINVRSADYAGSYNSTIFGGDLLSHDLNLNSGEGVANVAVNQLTGLVNETGNAAHVLAATDNLNIGNVCLSGDPTFFNTTGSITLNADILQPEDIVIVAAGDISSTAALTINAGDTSAGHNITLIAGADFVANSGTDSTTLPPLTNFGDVSLSGKASKTGGSILLGQSGLVNVLARASDFGTGNDAGGDIFMFAFAGKNAGSGVIDIANTTLGAQGNGTASNGNILLVAGASSTDSIRTGQLNTVTGTGAPGDVTIVTAQPVSSDKKQTINYAANGVRSGAELVASSKLSKAADVELTAGGGNSINVSGSFTVQAGGTISVNSVDVQTAALLTFDAGGDITSAVGTNPVRAATVSLTADGNIGSESDAFGIDTSSVLTLRANTSVANLFVANTISPGTVSFQSPIARNIVHIDAPGREVSIDEVFAGQSLIIRSFDIDTINNIFGVGNLLSITGLNAAAAPFFGGFFAIDNLVIDYASGIGSNANPFSTSSIGNVVLTAGAGKSVFVENSGNKSETMSITADSIGKVTGQGSVVLDTVAVANGTFAADITGKSLTVLNSVTAKDGIDLTNSNSKKGSIIFEAGSNVATNATAKPLGAINISVGGPGQPADNPGPFPNIQINEIGAQVVINGPGFKTSAPDNILTANGATLTINNGFKTNNIVFNGGVTITADPPVEPGTETFTTVGPTVIKHVGQNIVSAIAVAGLAPQAVSLPNSSLSTGVVQAISATDSGVNLFSVNNASGVLPTAEEASSDAGTMMWSSKRKRAETVWTFYTR